MLFISDPFQATIVTMPKRSHNAPSVGYRSEKRQKQSREEEQSRKWVAGEDDFVLNQRKHGSVIRVSQNRGRPVDLLVVNLRLWEGDRSSEFEEIADLNMPSSLEVIEKLDESQVEAVLKDVDEYLDLDTKTRHARYWRDVRTLCKERRRKLRESCRKRSDEAVAVDNAIAADIDAILKGKTYNQLLELEDQIRKTLKSKDGPVDVDFWSEVLDELLLTKAITRLDEFQQDVIKERCKRLVATQEAAAQRERQAVLKQLVQLKTDSVKNPIPYDPTMDEISKVDLIYKQNLHLYSPEQYLASMTSTRERVAAQKFVPMKNVDDLPKFVPSVINFNHSAPGDKVTTDLSQSLYEKEMARAVEENEENFVSEASIPGLRPSQGLVKPRYFNRVMLGYEWTKYNQQHYTADNPPRKMARGYKFNIFYPDLTNASQTPVYKIIRDEEGKDPKLREQLGAGESNTCIIQFHAQPPYQDIAFRIVDRPWDSSTHKNAGFKSRFENGVLQLHFRFKRVFYRKWSFK